MSGYQTVVVGTDGSKTSLRAVDRAGEIAARSNAKLIIATGYSRTWAARKSAAILQEASDRAKAAGAKNIEEQAIADAPVHALVDLAERVGADLLVVGSVGIGAIILGRLFSIPGNVSRTAKTDVLIVYTTG
jgi:nucleotide-binding universal stress UspA family protein